MHNQEWKILSAKYNRNIIKFLDRSDTAALVLRHKILSDQVG